MPDTVSQKYRRQARRAGLRSTRLHSVRHYSATELLAAGVDLRTVAGRLGHGSGGGTTLRFYAAGVAEAHRRATDTISNLLPRKVPTSPAPRNPYETVAAARRNDIESGALEPGSQLPTAVELAATHRVSVGTVSRALGLLKDAGLVEASRGRRATVRPGGSTPGR